MAYAATARNCIYAPGVMVVEIHYTLGAVWRRDLMEIVRDALIECGCRRAVLDYS